MASGQVCQPDIPFGLLDYHNILHTLSLRGVRNMLMANYKVKSAIPKCGTKLSLLSGACRRKTALSGICVERLGRQ
ncbi:hypothetical protein QQG55_9790 [Brugia pahangi]|uniref:Uncharacterized protein n=1 Tax=Brugia pahangi TaxID=6280 RepID=A0A0N4TDC7_BRUPA|nr:unnamed protein product [Brugia pahangi]